MNVLHKFLAYAACLSLLPVSVAAQETGGGLMPGRHDFGMPQPLVGVPTPEALRDSLVFASLSRDSLWLRPRLPQWHGRDCSAVGFGGAGRMGGVVPASGGMPFDRNPYVFDFNTSGVLTSWKGGAVVGSGFRATMPGLMSRHNASVGVVQDVGRFTFTGGVSADRYLLWRGTRTAYSVSGSVNYRFNDNVSATVFGRYSTNNSFYSMAAMPYMGTSGYGGYVTFMGETVGMDLGVERYYDPYARQWVTSPIITPKIKFGDKFTLDLPVGWLVKEALDNAFNKNKRRSGTMIMPEALPMPGQIPFAPPEMPK